MSPGISKKPILLVEDNEDDEALTTRALRNARINNEIIVAKDGAEALDIVFGTGEYEGKTLTPSIVLLDLKLPKLDGLDVLERLRADERTKTTPVVILTSSAEARDISASYDKGCNSFVTKPVEFNEFAKAVQQLGLYWLLLNEPLPEGV